MVMEQSAACRPAMGSMSLISGVVEPWG